MTLHDRALEYVALGWNVFPLLPNSKAPHGRLLAETGFLVTDKQTGEKTASWKPLQTLRVTEELVNEWWDAEPNANIGLICGHISGVTVIDIDVPKDDRKDYTDWEPDPFKIAYKICTPTLMSLSGGGGLHLFCKYEPGLKNSTKSIHPQVDIKNDGGYVVLPPSIHDRTRKPYKFDGMFALCEENMDLLADFPGPLKEIMVDRQAEGNTNADWEYILRGVREGVDGRNHASAKLIGKCLNSLFIGFNGDKQFLPFLWDFMMWWNEQNKPPMDKKELEHTFKSIVSRIL